MTSTSARYRPPFTATQWQELEHQALIYKYMSSGVPIPPDLIYTIRTSLDSRFLAQQPIGWGGCFQIGFGRKVDPEPGRCRRTDGKKWRCSKEAHPDSKYCEKHMHRGKNRSRKPVEVSSSISTTTATTTSRTPNLSPSIQGNFSTTTASPYNVFPSLSSPSSMTTTESSQSSSYNINTQLYPFLNPHSSSPKPFGLALSPQKNANHHMFLDSGNSCSQDDRFFRGMDERSFLEEASGSGRNCLHDTYEPLSMSSYYSQSELQHLSDNSGHQIQNEEGQSCFIWGTDFKSSTRPVKAEKEDGTPKPLHQFLGEWPPKGTDSWL